MCWTTAASVTMVVAGGAATAITLLRGDSRGVWVTLGYFTLMEALQATGYAVIDECGTPANRTITVLSYLHIALQPVFINAFAMAIAPSELSPRVRSSVWVAAGLASGLLVLRLAPFDSLGRCLPGDVLCGVDWCVRSGNWHLAWDVPLNGGLAALGIPGQFPAYIVAVFALPLLYGAWRFVLFPLAVGPFLALLLTDDPNEMPAVWCLFSIGIIVISLSPFVRHRVLGARMAARAHS